MTDQATSTTAAKGRPFERRVRPPRSLWVVEVLEGTHWRPSIWVGETREKARQEMRDWKAESCVERLRVVRYCPTAA